jgi:hypothetical protein
MMVVLRSWWSLLRRSLTDWNGFRSILILGGWDPSSSVLLAGSIEGVGVGVGVVRWCRSTARGDEWRDDVSGELAREEERREALDALEEERYDRLDGEVTAGSVGANVTLEFMVNPGRGGGE